MRKRSTWGFDGLNIKLLKNLDGLFGALLTRLLKEPPPNPLPDIKKILVIRPGGIGDAVLLIPAINSLKKKIPDAQITVLAEKRNGAIFSLCADVDRIFHYDCPKELFAAIRNKYDVVIDTEQWHRLSAVVARLTKATVSIGFATNERERLFTYPIAYSHDDYEMESYFNLLAPLGVHRSSEISDSFLIVPEETKKKVEFLLGPVEGKSYVAIFPGASIPERRWGGGKFRMVAEKINAKGIPVVVIGGKVDERESERIIEGRYGLNLAGKTSIAESAAVIEKSGLLISGDSGILHIGVGLGIPTVSLFGPGIAKKWAPRGNKYIVIDKNLPCSPCTRFGYTPYCTINAKCMADISVDEVVEAVERLFGMQKFIDNNDGKLI
jgi:ADP-heptose:LPS heptosyltransferase